MIAAILSLALIFGFSILSDVVLSHERLIHVVQQGLVDGELAYDLNPYEDYYTECSLLNMEFARPGNPFRSAVDTIDPTASGHPCQSLQTLVASGSPPCLGEPNTVCSAKIYWNARDAKSAEVTVEDSAVPGEIPFAATLSGAEEAPGIKATSRYIFRLYDTSNGGRSLLGSVVVRPAVADAPMTGTGVISATPPYHAGSAALANHYVRYLFGSRHLDGFLLSVLSLRQSRQLYGLLSYVSVIALLVGAWLNSRSSALAIAPLAFFLLFGFSMHHFGHLVGNAPGFFFGFFALAVFLAKPRLFRQPSNRIAFFIFLGFLTAYFDMLIGAIPVVLSITMAVNQLFYAGREASGELAKPLIYLRNAIIEAGAIFACFLGTYVVLTGIHLAVLSLLQDNVWHSYFGRLNERLGSDLAYTGHTGSISPRELVSLLWDWRFQLTAGGMVPATWLLFGAAVAWLLSLCLMPLVVARRSPAASVLLADVLIVTLAAAGILVWYLRFPSHTFQHLYIMVRLAALPAAYGLVVLILVVRYLATIYKVGTIVRIAAVSLLLSGAASALAMQNAFAAGMPEYSARFFDNSAVESLSCPVPNSSNLTPDKIIELKGAIPKPPLTLLGLKRAPKRTADISKIGLAGSWPARAYVATNRADGHPLLGVSLTPDGPLLNRQDGSISLASPARFYVHFCPDIGIASDLKYQVWIENRYGVTVSKE